MLRSFLFASAAVALAACGNQTPSAMPEQTVATGEDPFDTFRPWDEASNGARATSSGLQIIELAAGSDCEEGPKGTDRAVVHYEGRLTDGTLFDSSVPRSQPTTFPANGVIPGWTEALGMMCPGDDWMVYLPSDIAYGAQGTPGGPIPPNADLVFRVKLLADIDAQTYTGQDW